MFREHWDEFEVKVADRAEFIRKTIFQRLNNSKGRVEKIMTQDPFQSRQEFVAWGRAYVEKVKAKSQSEKVYKARESFFVLLRNFGINDVLVREAFEQNKKEVLDPLIGESIALVALILGWSQKDREAFSQALGEIGVAGVFAAKPFLCLIAICGLAYGYHEHFHSEAFKKGGVLGLAGIVSMTLTAGGFVGLLAAIVTILYLNKRIKVDRPVEAQLKEIFVQVKSGEFFSDVRASWSQFESFLSKLFNKHQRTDISVI